ncbi:hypothetical protein ES704_03652 [subsurface metagenome]|jgi:NTP pyrophosphatase (non-canonical NTP hydrolase)
MKKSTAKESLEMLRKMSISELIWNERVKQDATWGKQNHNNEKWFTIIGEEVGEIANAINEYNPTGNKRKYTKIACLENLEYELIQTAAVAIAWIECLRRNNPIESLK